MSKESSLTKLERARRVVAGLLKHVPPGTKFVIDGVSHDRDAVIAFFRAHVAAIDEKTLRYSAYQQAVAHEKAVAREANALWLGLYHTLEVQMAPSQLLAFGMKARSKPGPKTAAAKFAGAQKKAKKASKP